jgi:outer membrane autotransporter protein
VLGELIKVTYTRLSGVDNVRVFASNISSVEGVTNNAGDITRYWSKTPLSGESILSSFGVSGTCTLAPYQTSKLVGGAGIDNEGAATETISGLGVSEFIGVGSFDLKPRMDVRYNLYSLSPGVEVTLQLNYAYSYVVTYTYAVNGNYVLGPKEKLLINVASQADNDLLAFKGTASLNGTLETSWTGGYVPRPGLNYGKILIATEGVTGRFQRLLTNITPTVMFKPQYDIPNQVYLRLERDYINENLLPYLTANQRAVAGMLNNIANTRLRVPRGTLEDRNTVLSAIDALPTYTQAANAIDQLAPKGSDAQSGMGISAASFQASNISGRLSDLRQGVQGVSFSGLNLRNREFTTSGIERPILLASTGSNLTGMIPSGMDERFGLFVKGNAVFGDQRDTSEQTGYDFTNMGVTMGSDYRFTRNFIAGLMFGINTSRANTDNVGSKVTMDGYTFGTYGTYYKKGFFVDGQFSYGVASYDNSRRIVFPGIDRTATSSPNGRQFTAYGGTGYEFHVNKWTIMPTMSIQYTKLSVDSYTESGADALNLDVDRQNIESLQSNVGGRISYTWQVGKALVIPNIRASYGYEFLRDSKNITAQLAQGSSPFSIETISPNRNFVILGTGITVIAGNDISFSINYDAQLGDNKYTAHSVNAGLRILF